MKRIKLAQYADDAILFLRNTDEVLLVTKLLTFSLPYMTEISVVIRQ